MNDYTLCTDDGPKCRKCEDDAHAINWARLYHLRTGEHVTLMGDDGILAIMKGGVNVVDEFKRGCEEGEMKDV